MSRGSGTLLSKLPFTFPPAACKSLASSHPPRLVFIPCFHQNILVGEVVPHYGLDLHLPYD